MYREKKKRSYLRSLPGEFGDGSEDAPDAGIGVLKRLGGELAGNLADLVLAILDGFGHGRARHGLVLLFQHLVSGVYRHYRPSC